MNKRNPRDLVRGWSLCRPLRLAAVLAVTIAQACSANVSHPQNARTPASAAKLGWSLVPLEASIAADGSPVQRVLVRGGQVVRLEAQGSIDVGERVRAGDGFAETWTTQATRDGVLIVRPSPWTIAILTRPGQVNLAYLGYPRDPGYEWFDIEAAGLKWADGPGGEDLPRVAPRARMDHDGFAELDRALEEAVRGAPEHAQAMAIAKSIRKVAILRAVRSLRVGEGYPYLLNKEIEPSPKVKKVEIGERDFYEIAPAQPVDFRVDGPAMLHVWVRAARNSAGASLRVRISEGEKDRAETGTWVPPAASTETIRTVAADEEDDDAMYLPLRPLVVHVPPGHHAYRLHAHGAAAFVLPALAEFNVHMGDAASGAKREGSLLESAMTACDNERSAALCSLVRGVMGLDGGKAGGEDSKRMSWARALKGSSPAVQHVAETLAASGPRDPLAGIEALASQGDVSAYAKLSAAAAREVDEGVRASWIRATMRGTRWSPVDEGQPNGPQWAHLVTGARVVEGCNAKQPYAELGHEPKVVQARLWNGVPVVEFLASARCDGGGPIQLSVDGQRLAANPSSSNALWHVLVRGAQARVSRIDDTGGHVYAITEQCAMSGAHWSAMNAPLQASTKPKFGPFEGTAGLEVWMKDGLDKAELTVSPDGKDPNRGDPVQVRVVRGPMAEVAVDERGGRWRRAGRIAMPAWASRGMHVAGGDGVWVRPILRVPRTATDVAGSTTEIPREANVKKRALDERELGKISSSILAARPSDRGAGYTRRALLLAEAGAERPALADARAAKALGYLTDKGEDPELAVRSILRSTAPKALTLAANAHAYGIEPDFDETAKRCQVSSGPRAKFTELIGTIKAEIEDPSKKRPWDSTHAVQDYEVVNQNAVDPRGNFVLAHAMQGSRWQLLHQVVGAPAPVTRERNASAQGLLEADGDLRARILAGDPFRGSKFVVVTDVSPSRASLAHLAPAKARIDFACVARSPQHAIDGQCPLTMMLGAPPTGKPIALRIGESGRGSVEIPPVSVGGPAAQIIVELKPTPARWVALVRVVLDREVPNSTFSPGVGWVLTPSGLQRRFLLRADESMSLRFPVGLVRLDARPEPSSKASVTATAGGKEYEVPTDGQSVVIQLARGGAIQVSAAGGPVTLGVAQRVPYSAQAEDGEEAEAEPEDAAASTVEVIPVGQTHSAWRGIAAHSDSPISPMRDSLGTLRWSTQVQSNTYREGMRDSQVNYTDAFVAQTLEYRRRLEALNLWLQGGGSFRFRDASSSRVLNALAYEDYDPYRLRIFGSFSYASQRIEGLTYRTMRPRFFAEYSGRASSTFYILPRIAYDGFMTNHRVRPVSLRGVDDDVFNVFRAKRPQLLYGQLLLWWAPYFNGIFYVRPRATFAAKQQALSHVSGTAGFFVAFDQFELNAHSDSIWYNAIERVRADSAFETGGGLTAAYNLWVSDGSLDVKPGVSLFGRNGGGGWMAMAFVDVLASFHRGLRDFSSVDLAFPEQIGRGVRWRGHDPGQGAPEVRPGARL